MAGWLENEGSDSCWRLRRATQFRREIGYDGFDGRNPLDMKIHELRTKAEDAEDGEYILGSRETGSHACYLIYGILRPGVQGRVVKPGAGHEEIVLAVKGDIVVSGAGERLLHEGEAFHIAGADECLLGNPSAQEVVYVIAGGHSDGGHH